ncbi:MAG: sel1 repeat family protein [Neisseriaceae bacterium]|nr:sel1 repeat family protein [Neisseriaceae bacterium]
MLSLDKMAALFKTLWLCGLLSLSAPLWAQDVYEQGYAAYQKRDYQSAKALYEQAAKAGDGKAMNSLGTLYELGQGVPVNYGQALRWYEQAQEAGSVAATGNLGALHERGLGTPKNYFYAITYYFMGLNQGDAKSMNNLGVMAGTDEVLPFNLPASWALLGLAKDYGDPYASDNQKHATGVMTAAQKQEARRFYQQLKNSPQRTDTLVDYLGF